MKSVFIVLALGISSVLGSAIAYGQENPAEQERHFQDQIDRAIEQNERLAQQTENINNQQNSGPTIAVTSQPKFSAKAGKVQPGTKVSITCSTPNAVIYYNTTGWSPTTSSRRYTGPITVNATTDLQAFAAAPNMANSRVTSASYTVKGTAVPVYPLTLAADGVLHAKTRLHLATNSNVSSKNAKVGDKISILLDQDVKVGNTVVIPKGTPVDAVITAVTPSSLFGISGSISFAVHSLAVRENTISLQGGERLDGINHSTRAAFMWVTFVGVIPAVMMHGGDADIKPGMKFTVGVVTDTPLKL
jgi:hypothetical protein